MRLIAKATRILHAKFHCNRLTTVQDIQDYASRIFWDTLYMMSTRYTSVGLALLQCPPVYSDVKRPVSLRSVKIVSRIESCGKFKSVTDTKRCHIM